MIWGTDATSAGVMGVAAICGAGATCGSGEAGAGWDAGPTGAWAGSGVVAGLGWVAAFGVAIMSAPAGTLAAGTVAAVLRSTCPSTVLWSCCWCMIQGGQYADDGHGDRQKDQQEFIRTCPKKMHLTPPVRPPQKLTRYTRKSNQMRLSEMLLSPALYANSRNPLLETGAAQLRWNASTPLRSAAPTRTFQGKLSLSRRQPRGTYRMNERSRQTAPVAPQGTTLGLPHETAHETVHVYRLRA